MALTPEDLRALQRPFRYADHSFLRGFVYLSEEAITARLEEVDPSWTLEILNVRYEGAQAIVLARMTVCGVYRDGIGMQKVIETAGEADKGAATDALKRAARLFGVGRYLLDAPKGDGERPGRDFAEWLAKSQREAGLTPPAPAEPKSSEPQPPADNSVVQAAQANGGTVTRRETKEPQDKDPQDDLTNRDTAADFLKATRAAGISDNDVLAALDVKKLSEWKHGRKAAGRRVKEWQAKQPAA